jgi:hypothetical protein
MKIFLKKLVISLLASTVGFAGNQVWATHPRDIAPVQIAQAQTQVVPVVFPCLARVVLKSGGSKSGRLTDVDAKSQQLTLSRGRQSEPIAIAQIEKVTFYPNCDTLVPDNPRSHEIGIMIRGDKRTWSNIPLNNLKIRDGDKGRAEINLPPGVDSKVSKERLAVYVIQELSFVTGNKVTLGVVVNK